jgi:hypothetical protein
MGSEEKGIIKAVTLQLSSNDFVVLIEDASFDFG